MISLTWDVDEILSSRLLDSPSVKTDNILEEHDGGEELPADKEGVCLHDGEIQGDGFCLCTSQQY